MMSCQLFLTPLYGIVSSHSVNSSNHTILRRCWTALLRYNWYTINCSHLKCTIWRVLTYANSCKAMTTIEIVNTSIIPKHLFMSICNSPSSPPTSLVSYSSPSVIMHFPRILYKWDLMVYFLILHISCNMIILRYIVNYEIHMQ